MKKYIIACAAVLLIAAGALHAYLDHGMFRASRADGPQRVIACVEEGEILVDAGSGMAPFEIRGVELGSAGPGHVETDYPIDFDTYLRWFGQIAQMGANTVRVRTVQGPAFYEALRAYNEGADQPLFLLQGVWLDDYAQNSHIEAFDDEFLGTLVDGARMAIDVVHGSRPALLGRFAGSGSYTADVSRWTLGYIIGTVWEGKTVAYTDLEEAGMPRYEGAYVSASEDSTPFESVLAEVLDAAFAYESERYGEQRLLSVSNGTLTDPFEYPDDVREFFGKSSEIDIEHLVASDRVESGLFASYQVRPVDLDPLRFDSELQGKLDPHGVANTYYAYVRRLVEHHDAPVVITGLGSSAARGKSHVDAVTWRDEGGVSEGDQARAIVQGYRDVMEAGCAGSVIYCWQDDWSRRAWNTIENVDLLKAPCWSDAQTSGQSFGLIALEPGESRSACYVDGDDEEWGEEDALGSSGGRSVYAKYDERFVYLMARGEGISPDAPLYLPIDITPRSGAVSCADPALSFERPADFLVALDGRAGARVLVQERYEVLRATSLLEVTGEDPYVDPPAPDSPVFVPINLLLQPYADFSQMGKRLPYATESGTGDAYALVYETGRLALGDGNPSHGDYDSLADYCYGDGFVEVRLPWQLLNFANPSQMQVHDDYYAHYGVEYLSIDELHVGIGDGSGAIEMFPMALAGWGSEVAHHERPRASYAVLTDLWHAPDAVARASELLDAVHDEGGGAR